MQEKQDPPQGSNNITNSSGYNLYASQVKTALSQREREAKALLKAANSMQAILENWEEADHEDITVSLEYNKNLWGLFYERAEQRAQSDVLANKLVMLGNFVFQQSHKIIQESENNRKKQMLNALINVNREIASGLFKVIRA